MKHRISFIVMLSTCLTIFYIFKQGILQTAFSTETTVSAKLGESFTLNKGQSAKITDARDGIILEFNGFLKIPGRGIASGIFPSYRLLINGKVVENYSVLHYDVDISHENHDYETAIFTIWDSIQKCMQMKDGVMPNGLKAYNKDACWSQLALRLSDVEYCRRIPNSKGRNACIEYLLEKFDNPKLCDEVETPLMYCKYRQAVLELNPDMCVDVIRVEYMARCFKEISEKTGEGIAMCDRERVKEKNYVELCRESIEGKSH